MKKLFIFFIALLPFFLAVAAWRYLRIDRQGGGWMLVGALLMILIQMPASAGGLLLGDIPLLAALLGAPITAMMQGVLLGGALTLLAAALRLILGRR